ncbi:MAG: hypothetical protein ACRCX2_36560 [Paraclostridium sp.]
MTRYIIFGHGRYFVTTNALGGFIFQKKEIKKMVLVLLNFQKEK